MLLTDIAVIRSIEERAPWASLQRFHNVNTVTEQLVKLHGLNKQQAQNARKQARQLRFCLMQAREYFLASKVVSLATKPTLLYYSIMSLALAEVLLKQSGDSSLDRAREHHRHHGLLFSDTRTGNLSERLEGSAGGLLARPMVQGETKARMGTFELWHRGARPMPYVGERILHLPGGQSSRTQALISIPEDKRMPLLPEKGVTLLDCIQRIPDLTDLVNAHGVNSSCVRGKIQLDEWETPQRNLLRFTIHPNKQAAQVLDGIMFSPSLVNCIEVIEFPSGATIRLTLTPTSPDGGMHLPTAAARSVQEFCCWLDDEPPLNEFGYFYSALFIAGNYARYYPDRWIADVENSTDLALAIEELVAAAERRIPWLTLSELSRTYHVFEN
ncbi:YaaC family protein [Bradyrhizobium yuanmingense]|uniref:YaaC family protein n=1 Tax=Bradyrhizobium yuanmingense TaxID=108015 RepID=UPI003F7DA42B